MNWKNEIKQQFYFHKKERKAILLLISLLAIFYFCFHWYHSDVRPTPNDFTKMDQTLTRFKQKQDSIRESERPKNKLVGRKSEKGKTDADKATRASRDQIRPQIFEFDPNTVSYDSLLLLGFSYYAASNVIKYRQAGGVYEKQKDLLKIYGADTALIQKLYTFIKLPENVKPNKGRAITSQNIPLLIDINSANKEEIIRLRGIGTILSARIIKFRNSLGGFYSVDQLAEVYNLSDTTFQQIKSFIRIDTNDINKIHLNTCTMETLQEHPYISRKEATIIINYRLQHGPYKSVQELKKIKIFSSQYVNKIIPYLTSS